MRKYSFFLLLISLSLCLSSCDVPGGGTAKELPVKEAPVKEEPEPITIGAENEPSTEEEEEKIVIPSAPEEEATPVEEVIPEEEEEESFEGYVLSEDDIPENKVFLKSTAVPGETVMDFAGDINFDDRYANMVSLRSRGGGLFDSIGSSLINRTVSADIFMINNEFPYSSRGTPAPGKKFTFRAKPETVSFMQDLGADIVSLANNHAYDHGPDALLDTFDTLDGAGIPYVGAGHNLEEAMMPVYFIAGGMKISFVSATQIERSLPPDTKEATETDPGVLRTLEPEKFLSVIRKAKETSDFCVAYVHWGSEGTNKYEQAQTELAKAYEEAGADLIMGDHPHVLQGITYINDTPVFYSLGNYWFNSKSLDTCLVEVVLSDGRIKSLQIIPATQRSCVTKEAPKGSEDYNRILDNMRSWSTENVDIDEDGFIRQKS